MSVELDKNLPVEERPEEISTLNIERKEVVQPVPSNFTAQVNDDSGKPMIQTPPAKVITIALPKDQSTLFGWSKGDAADSLTGFALFWLRMIKKAMHFGWNIILGEKK